MGLFDWLTGSKSAPAGVARQPASELRARLLGVNRDTAPFIVRDGAPESVDLVAEWKIVDARWYEIFAKAGLERVFKVLMKFDEAKGEVRAARTFQRIVTPAAFAGPVEQGVNYVLVDDHVGIGGTLANLRGHIEANGGTVIAMTTLTESRDGRRISLRPATLAMLRDRHGEALDRLWQRHFGHGLDCLTEVEAQNLCRQQSVAAIEDFLAQAAIEARGRGLEAAVGDG